VKLKVVLETGMDGLCGPLSCPAGPDIKLRTGE
jgi:hypothetical protein